METGSLTTQRYYWYRRITIALISLVAVVAIVIGSALWYLNQNGGLQRWVENRLSMINENVMVQVGEASLSLQFSKYPIQVNTKDIEIFATEQSVVLPEAYFGFTFSDLIFGQGLPRSVTLNRLAFEVEYSADGWHTGDSFAMLMQTFSQGYDGDLKDASQQNTTDGVAPDTNALPSFHFPIDRLTINSGKMTMLYPSSEADEDNLSLDIDGIMIDIIKADDQIDIAMAVDSPDFGGITLDGTLDPQSLDLDIKAVMDDFDSGRFYPYLGINLPELRDLGKISGEARVKMMNREVTTIAADIQAQDGHILMPSVGLVTFDTAASRFTYDKSIDRLLLEKLSISAPETSAFPGEFSLKGEIRNASLPIPQVRASFIGQSIPIETFLKLIPDVDRISHDQHGPMINGGRINRITVDLLAHIDRTANQFEFDALNVAADVADIPIVTGLGPVERLDGILAGQVNFVLEPDGSISVFETRLTLTDGNLKPQFGDLTIPIKGMELWAELDGKVVVVHRLAMDAMDHGQLALQAKLYFENDLSASMMESQIVAEQVNATLVGDLWPEALFPRSRKWLRKHVIGGVINGFKLNIGLDLKEEKPKPLFVEGGGQLKTPTLHYLIDHQPIEDADISLSFSGTKLGGTNFNLTFNDGMANAVDLKGSELAMFNKDGVTDMSLSLLGRGDLKKLMQILNEPKLNILEAGGLSPEGVKGVADVTGAIKWQVSKATKNLSVKDFDVKISANMDGASLPSLPEGIGLKNGALTLQYNNGDTRINGSGQINNADAKFNLRLDQNTLREAIITFDQSEMFTKILNSRLPLGLEGETAGRIHLIPGDVPSDVEVKIDLNLQNSRFYIPRLELTKLEGEDAQVTARLDISNGQLRKISNIEVISDAISLKGDIFLDQERMLKTARFDIVEWPGNVLSDVEIRREADESLSISASASVMDLRPLRLKESPGEGLKMQIDLSADRLLLDSRLSVAGNVSIQTREDGSGKADFLGNLYLMEAPFITEATLAAEFGNDNEYMRGQGLIGGVEADLMMRSGQQDGDHLVLTTGNAGQVLKALSITDAIRGGEMTMTVLYAPDDAKYYSANFALTDFRVIEAPTAVRMLSVLSLAGLYSLIEGDGTAFTEGQARISVTPDEQRIEYAKARGDALAIELTGLINRNDDTLDVSGALFPVYLITQLLGHVPLVGELVTGINHEGVFNTRFRMKGPVDDPNIDVRLSSIAPGLLRDIFSPDWISNERSRLLGEDASSSPEQ